MRHGLCVTPTVCHTHCSGSHLLVCIIPTVVDHTCCCASYPLLCVMLLWITPTGVCHTHCRGITPTAVPHPLPWITPTAISQIHTVDHTCCPGSHPLPWITPAAVLHTYCYGSHPLPCFTPTANGSHLLLCVTLYNTHGCYTGRSGGTFRSQLSDSDAIP